MGESISTYQCPKKEEPKTPTVSVFTKDQFEMKPDEVLPVTGGHGYGIRNLPPLDEVAVRRPHSTRISIDDISLRKSEIRKNFNCQHCQEQNFAGDRYQCVECDNYILCADCFERRKTSTSTITTAEHDSSHLMVFIGCPEASFMFNALNSYDKKRLCGMKQADFECLLGKQTFGVKCDSCQASPIRCLLCKCDDCHDLHWCWDCSFNEQNATLATKRKHQSTHWVVAHFIPAETLDLGEVKYTSEVCGKGCFGTVEKVQYKGAERALKCVVASNDPKERFMQEKAYRNEVQAYFQLQSNSIVKFYAWLHDEDNCKMYILLEYMPGGNLKRVISKKEPVPFDRRLRWLVQISKAVRLLHRKGFVHLDIKCDNVLLSANKMNAKIADMGTAMHDGGTGKFNGACFPEKIFAPELKFKQPFDFKVDVFSFGVLLTELFTYEFRNLAEFPVNPSQESPFLPKIIRKCVDMDSSRRPSAAEVETTLVRWETAFWSSLRWNAANAPLFTEVEYEKADFNKKNEIFEAFYSSIAPKSLGERPLVPDRPMFAPTSEEVKWTFRL